MSKDKLTLIMKYIEDSTNETKYKYYCAYGTLLGTIREKGIISWDEDCDIWVPIDYYDEFIETLNTNNKGEFSILTSKDEKYSHLFARVVIKGENHLETSVDIFPLVGISENINEQKKFILQSKFYFKFYYAKKVPLAEYKNNKIRGMEIMFAKLAVTFLSENWFKKKYINQCYKYPYTDSKLIYNICGSYGKREVLKKEWFSSIIRTEFEGDYVNSPVGYDKLLTHIYGEYMIPKKYV